MYTFDQVNYLWNPETLPESMNWLSMYSERADPVPRLEPMEIGSVPMPSASVQVKTKHEEQMDRALQGQERLMTKLAKPELAQQPNPIYGQPGKRQHSQSMGSNKQNGKADLRDLPNWSADGNLNVFSAGNMVTYVAILRTSNALVIGTIGHHNNKSSRETIKSCLCCYLNIVSGVVYTPKCQLGFRTTGPSICEPAYRTQLLKRRTPPDFALITIECHYSFRFHCTQIGAALYFSSCYKLKLILTQVVGLH